MLLRVIACCFLVVLTLLLGFLQHSFLKQFYASVTKSDYITLRLGFIMVSHLRFSVDVYLTFILKLHNKSFTAVDTLQGQPEV